MDVRFELLWHIGGFAVCVASVEAVPCHLQKKKWHTHGVNLQNRNLMARVNTTRMGHDIDMNTIQFFSLPFSTITAPREGVAGLQ